jgi:phage baseplate assembly protein V
MSYFSNTAKLIASNADATRGEVSFGIVTSYNPATHCAKVSIQPQEDNNPLISGWLPICTPCLGNGWGVVAPPAIGEQVVIIPDSGDTQHGIIIGSVFSQPSQPPKPGGTTNTQNGEIALVHSSGAYIKLNNDGSVTIDGHAMVTITATSSIQLVTPVVNTSGNLTVATGATGSFPTPTGETVTVQSGIIANIG